MIKISDLVPSLSGRVSIGIDSGSNDGSFSISSMAPLNRVILLSGVFVDPILGQSGIIRFNYNNRSFEFSSDGGLIFRNLNQSLDDAYQIGNEVNLNYKNISDKDWVCDPVIFKEQSYNSNPDLVRSEGVAEFYRDFPAKFAISVSGYTPFPSDPDLAFVMGGSYLDLFPETVIGTHFVCIRGSGILRNITDESARIESRPAFLWLGVSGAIEQYHDIASIRSSRHMQITAKENINVNSDNIIKIASTTTTFSATSGILFNAGIISLNNLYCSGNGLFATQSGQFHLGYSSQIGPTIVPFGSVHCNSGVFHDSIHGGSGIIRFNRNNPVGGNGTSGAMEYSINGGESFEPIVTFTQTVFANFTGSANAGAVLRGLGTSNDNDQRLQVPSGMKCVILACEGVGRAAITSTAGTYIFDYGIRAFGGNETAVQSGTDYILCSSTALRGAIHHAFAEGTVRKPLVTLNGGTCWLPIFRNNASSPSNTGSHPKVIVITYKYIDDSAY